MKTISFLGAALLLILSGCGGDDGALNKNEPVVEPASTAVVEATGRTLFGIEESDEGFTVTFTPVEEPISSVQVVLNYNSEQLTVGDIVPAEGVIPFLSENNNGVIEFIAAVSEDLYGENLPLFSISANLIDGVEESEVSFDANNVYALRPDIQNTDTAVTDNLPTLLISNK